VRQSLGYLNVLLPLGDFFTWATDLSRVGYPLRALKSLNAEPTNSAILALNTSVSN